MWERENMSELEAAPAAQVEMTPALIRGQCRKHHGYTTPELNERLYLHHLSLCTLGHLEPYAGCRALYVQQNYIRDLAPLACLGGCLRSLYIADNCLSSCESLPRLPLLELLDISGNAITALRGVSAAAPALETLLAARNPIAAVSAAELAPLSCLTSLDLSHARLEEEEDLLPAVRACAATLRTLVLTGNKFVARARHYRRRVVHALPELRFLDECPVFPEERERVDAFAAGGASGEREKKQEIDQRNERERQEQFAFFEEARRPPREKRLSQGQHREPSAYLLSQGNPDDDDDPIYIP